MGMSDKGIGRDGGKQEWQKICGTAWIEVTKICEDGDSNVGDVL